MDPTEQAAGQSDVLNIEGPLAAGVASSASINIPAPYLGAAHRIPAWSSAAWNADVAIEAMPH